MCNEHNGEGKAESSMNEGLRASGRGVGAMALKDEPSPSACGDPGMKLLVALLLTWCTEPWRNHTSAVWVAAGHSQQCPPLGPWKSSWAFFGPALTTTCLLGPLEGVCLLSLKVHFPLPSHFLELTILFDPHSVVKAGCIQK